MSISFMKRAGIVAAGAAAALAASTLPASALGISLGGGSSLLHLQDCRTVAVNRAVDQNISFSSVTTGGQTVHVSGTADGSLTLCWSVDALTPTGVEVTTWTNATVDAVLANLLGQGDASLVCSAIRLHTAPGVRGVMSGSAHLNVSGDNLPPTTWDYVFARDGEISGVGEDIVISACTDTNGNTSVS